jgi:hypothetical protein
MAWTDLSSTQELKRDIPALRDSDITNAQLQRNIDDAKEIVYDDLSKWVDWSEIEALDSVPRVINRLSRYKSAELTIVRSWQHDTDIVVPGVPEPEGVGEISAVVNYFSGEYHKLLGQIRGGDILILDDSNEELEYDAFRKPGLGRVI